MPVVSQITLEKKYLVCMERIRGGVSPEEAFGMAEDWILPLDGPRAILNPLRGIWYLEDALHKEWLATKFGVGVAIFVSAEGLTGAKALPVHGAPNADEAVQQLAGFCMWRRADELYGPDLLQDILQRAESGVLVWSPLCSEWLIPADLQKKLDSVEPLKT